MIQNPSLYWLLTFFAFAGHFLCFGNSNESQLRIGKAVNIFVRYGYLSISMKVISNNDTERWLFKEPTRSIYKDLSTLTETKEENSPGVFHGDFHMEFCDNRRQLYQAYFRDFTIERLDKPWEAFTGGWHADLAAKKLGINTAFIRGEYSYVLVRVARFRETGKLKKPIPPTQVLENDVVERVRELKMGNSTAAVQFMNAYGTHYINSYTTGNTLYQVFVYNKMNYQVIKDRLKSRGISSTSRLDLYNFFAPWYAEHMGQIRSASGNATVERWARRKLQYQYYVFRYATLLKLHGNGTLLRALDELLGNEAILQLDLKALNIIFKEPEKKKWFLEVLDNYMKLWEEWCKHYDDGIVNKKLDFEEASYFYKDSPLWERHRKKKRMNLSEFWKFQQNEGTPEKWVTFSYKNLLEIPQSCREGIDFKFCGFPGQRDVSFWLSSAGAHTPCHYDTYGCNIVVQVYGRKMWLLFPPDSNFTPLRVPYEESSVYSFETFYSPKDLSQLKHIEQNCYKCILEPGDVLIVPNKWWHYVESLTSSLSINTWIPLEIDNDARLEECIVRYIVKKLTQSEDNNELIHLLNPNEFGQLEEEGEHLSILSYLFQILTNNGDLNVGIKGYAYRNLDETELSNIAESLETEWIAKLSVNEFCELVKQQTSRYKPQEGEPKNALEIKLKEALINSLCNPSTIEPNRAGSGLWELKFNPGTIRGRNFQLK